MSEEMIKKRLKIIDDLEEEIRKIKALYQESLENDENFQEIQEQEQKFKEETKEKKITVLEKPELKNFNEQIKQIRDDIKENREVLSQELADYYKDSGSMEITDSDGNVKRIVFSAKLIDFGGKE